MRLACGPSAPQQRTVRSYLFSPNQRNILSGTKLRLAGGPSAPHGRTVRRSTLKPTPERHPFWYKLEIQWRTVRPPGPDCPPAHQSLCKLSGTGADCPPLRRGLSVVTQSALNLSCFPKLININSNSFSFANVPTPLREHHHVHVC